MDFDKALGTVVRANDASVPEHFIQLVRGDCREKIKQIPDNSIDLMITDPPYHLDGLDGDWKKGKGAIKSTGTVGGLPVGMKFDLKQGRNLQAFMGTVGADLLPAMKPGAFGVVFSQPRLSHRMAVGLEDCGFEIRDMLAWHFTKRAQFKAFSQDHFIDRKTELSPKEKKQMKRLMLNRKTAQLRPQFESMILIQKPKEGTYVENWQKYRTGLMDSTASLVSGKSPSTVMVVEKPDKAQCNKHLTVKPVKLVEHLINLYSLAGQTVLDPFLGSGTTAIACMNTGRSCIGIEIEKEYIEISEQRMREAK